MRDLHYACRQLKRSPGFAFAAVATMALAIGANTGIFSVVYGLLLDALPFRDSGRIVTILETIPQAPGPLEVTYPDYEDWRAQQRSFDELAAYSTLNPDTLSLRLNDHSEQVGRVLASDNFFSLLGVSPLLGRTFKAEDDLAGSNHVVVLSARAWQRYFSRDPGIIGRSVDLNGSSYTVIGVLPPRAEFPSQGDVWLPLSLLDQATRSSHVWHSVRVLGRLHNGVTLKEARTEMQMIAGHLASANPATNRNVGIEIRPLREQLIGTLRPAILCIMGSVLLVLLIACVNVGNLFMVKAVSLERYIVIRQALGASRARLFSQFLAQALLLCLIGGVFGVALARASLPLLRVALSHVVGLDPSMLQAIRLSTPVLAVTLGACIMTSIFFGLLPVLGIPLKLPSRLQVGDRSHTRDQQLRQNALLAAEVAVAVVVLFLSVLMIRSFQSLLAVDPGYRTDHLLSFEITLPEPRYQDGSPETDQFYSQLLNKLQAVPGIVSVSSTTQLPLSPSVVMTRLLIEGQPPVAPGAFPSAQIRFVSPEFFSTMGLRFEGGRPFTQQEMSNHASVFIVNHEFVQRYLSSRNPLSARILMGVLSPKPTSVPVIGVVASAHEVGVGKEPPPEIFLPGFGVHEVLLLRTASEPGAMIPAVREAVHDLDASQPIYHIQTIENVLSDSVALPRMTSILLSVFALVALVLALIGVYGILSYSVVQRTREIGLRIAVGAQRQDILKMVIGQAFRFAAAGIVSGLFLAFIVARVVNGLLFQTSQFDPFATGLTVCILIAGTAVAAAIPARRAAMLNPTDALHSE